MRNIVILLLLAQVALGGFIDLGTNQQSNVQLGTNLVQYCYLGTHQVWMRSVVVPWTPTYAIRCGLTNGNQYTDTGLMVQKGWTVNMLVQVRSNGASRVMGTPLAGSYLYFGAGSEAWSLRYGDSALISGSVPNTGWHFVQVSASGLTCTITTNGTQADTVTAGSFTTNTTTTFKLGSVNSANTSVPWDIARVQLVDQAGTVERDLIATQYGYFTDVVTGVGYPFGVNGVGGTALDVTNVAGQAFPSMSWATSSFTGWHPEWAMQCGLTNRSSGTDTGLKPQGGWGYSELFLVRSNVSTVAYQGSGVQVAGSNMRLNLQASALQVNYGSSSFATTAVIQPNVWYQWSLYATNAVTTFYAYTNGVQYTTPTAYTVFSGNTYTWFVGHANGSAAGFFAAIPRTQIWDNTGTLRIDLMALPVGWWWDNVSRTFFPFSAGAGIGDSRDTTNVLGQAFPGQTWK